MHSVRGRRISPHVGALWHTHFQANNDAACMYVMLSTGVRGCRRAPTTSVLSSWRLMPGTYSTMPYLRPQRAQLYSQSLLVAALPRLRAHLEGRADSVCDHRGSVAHNMNTQVCTGADLGRGTTGTLYASWGHGACTSSIIESAVVCIKNKAHEDHLERMISRQPRWSR